MTITGSRSWFCYKNNWYRNNAWSWWSCNELTQCAPLNRRAGKGSSISYVSFFSYAYKTA